MGCHINHRLDLLTNGVLHLRTDSVSHVLIESPQQNGPDHNRHVIADAMQEAGTLQTHVRGTYAQRLARVVRQGEKVVTEVGIVNTNFGRDSLIASLFKFLDSSKLFLQN